MDWLVPIILVMLLSIPILAFMDMADCKRVFVRGAYKYVKQVHCGMRLIWRTDYPDIAMRRKGLIGCWDLVNIHGGFIHSTKVIDSFPYGPCRKAVKSLNEYLFDTYLAPSMTDPLLEKYDGKHKKRKHK